MPPFHDKDVRRMAAIVDFVLGRSVFYVNAGVVLFCKLLTMYFCWFFAMLIAPIGLLYIYILHSRTE